MKYRLMVSYDCGCSYGLDMESDDIAKLEKRGEKHDADGMRWCIEDETGKQHGEACKIFKRIMGDMVALNMRKGEEG